MEYRWARISTFVGVACSVLALFSFAFKAPASEDKVVCGVAQGYPPYQFRTEGDAVGIDVDVMRLIFKKMGRELTFRSDNWDDVVASLRLGTLDCIAGMEISEHRKIFFDFTSPYYCRKGMVFVLANSFIQSINDLQWQVVAGDRDTFVEQMLREKGLYKRIRLYQPKSKEQAMLLLKDRQVVAIIAPRAVGEYLARKHDVPVRMIDVGDPGTPVGLAVAKGNKTLLRQLDIALHKLAEDGSLDEILVRWQIK